METLRRAILILANFTGWGRAEIHDMDEADFWADLLEAQKLNTEMAEAMKA